MQTSTGIIDYYLKCGIEGGFSKITSTRKYSTCLYQVGFLGLIEGQGASGFGKPPER